MKGDWKTIIGFLTFVAYECSSLE